MEINTSIDPLFNWLLYVSFVIWSQRHQTPWVLASVSREHGLNVLPLPRWLESDHPRARQRLSLLQLPRQSSSACTTLSFDTLRCIINTLALSRGHETFSGGDGFTYQRAKKKTERKEEKKVGRRGPFFFLQPTAVIWLWFFFCCCCCLLISMGSLVGSHLGRTCGFWCILKRGCVCLAEVLFLTPG